MDRFCIFQYLGQFLNQPKFNVHDPQNIGRHQDGSQNDQPLLCVPQCFLYLLFEPIVPEMSESVNFAHPTHRFNSVRLIYPLVYIRFAHFFNQVQLFRAKDAKAIANQ